MSATADYAAFAPRPLPMARARGLPFAPQRDRNQYADIVWWILVYFWFLIFEGALRKWTFGSAANLFLVIRDPIALIIYAKALTQRVFPFNPGMLLIGLLACVGLTIGVFQIMDDQMNPLVVAYGWRCYFLQLPMIFIIPRVLTFPDLQKLGRWILILAIPMTVLMSFQFWLPQGHWLNASAIEGRYQISAGVGRIRPPGTFSFITGPSSYYPWVIAFLFAAMTWRKAYPGWLRVAAAVSAVLVLPISGSRSMMVSYLLVLLLAATGLHRSEQIRRQMIFLLLVAVVAIPVFSVTPLFKAGVEVFQERWEAAAAAEDTEGRSAVVGMSRRTYGDLTGFIDAMPDTPPIGLGIGVGTNVGATLMQNRATFQLAEAEWPRTVQEMGPVMGTAMILMRISLTVYLFVTAWRSFRQDDNTLAWLLFAACGPIMLYGGTGQPTNLGFMVFGAGLCLAAARNPTPVFQANQDQPWL